MRFYNKCINIWEYNQEAEMAFADASIRDLILEYKEALIRGLESYARLVYAAILQKGYDVWEVMTTIQEIQRLHRRLLRQLKSPRQTTKLKCPPLTASSNGSAQIYIRP